MVKWIFKGYWRCAAFYITDRFRDRWHPYLHTDKGAPSTSRFKDFYRTDTLIATFLELEEKEQSRGTDGGGFHNWQVAVTTCGTQQFQRFGGFSFRGYVLGGLTLLTLNNPQKCKNSPTDQIWKRQKLLLAIPRAKELNKNTSAKPMIIYD